MSIPFHRWLVIGPDDESRKDVVQYIRSHHPDLQEVSSFTIRGRPKEVIVSDGKVARRDRLMADYVLIYEHMPRTMFKTDKPLRTVNKYVRIPRQRYEICCDDPELYEEMLTTHPELLLPSHDIFSEVSQWTQLGNDHATIEKSCDICHRVPRQGAHARLLGTPTCKGCGE